MHIIIHVREQAARKAYDFKVMQDEDDPSLVVVESQLSEGLVTNEFSCSPETARELSAALLIVAENAEKLWG